MASKKFKQVLSFSLERIVNGTIVKSILSLCFMAGLSMSLSAQDTKGPADDLKWIDPATETQTVISGNGWSNEIGNHYLRLPERAKSVVRSDVWNLSCQTAGLYVKFHSNATTIRIEYQVTGGYAMNHEPATGVSGVDLYVTLPNGKQAWCSPNSYGFGDTCRYAYQYLDQERAGRTFQLFLPLYNGVKNLRIGVADSCTLSFLPSESGLPIVCYGTSICQGACASRPGMAWTNILERYMKEPVINLGFSGNGQLEKELFDLLTEIPAKLYVIDCMPNMCYNNRLALIHDRLIAGVRILRAKSHAPILLVEHDGYNGHFASKERFDAYNNANIELRKAYEELQSEGIKGIYYLTHDEIGLDMDAQVDGTHATDWGMVQYAKAYQKIITEIFKSKM